MRLMQGTDIVCSVRRREPWDIDGHCTLSEYPAVLSFLHITLRRILRSAIPARSNSRRDTPLPFHPEQQNPQQHDKFCTRPELDRHSRTLRTLPDLIQ